MSSLLDQNVEHESSVHLEPGVTSSSLTRAKEDYVEPEDTNEKGRSEVTSNTNNQEEDNKDMQSMPGDTLSKHMELIHGKAATRYNSALNKILKALCNIQVLKEDLVHNTQPFSDNQVPCALQHFLSAFVMEQIQEGLYSDLLSNLLVSLENDHSLSCDAAEVVVAILEFWHSWKSPERESMVTRLFTWEEYGRMSCSRCRRVANYPKQSSYRFAMAADSVRDLKYVFGNIEFEYILKWIRMENKMSCEGCGKKNFVHHTISRCPPIFTIVLEWEKNETEEEIRETTKALKWEIDISRMYEGLEPKATHQLVSMIGCAEEGNYTCMAYKKNQWVSLRHEASEEEVVGNWKSVVRLCGERKIRLEVLFYEAV